MRIKRSRKTVAVAAVIGLLAAGGAYAYWTTTGSGTGSGNTAAGALPVTIVQTSATSGLMPGGSPVVLAGNFNNPNTAPTSVAGVFASVTGTNKTGCLAVDYVIEGAATVSASIPVGVGGSWTGQTIKLNNTALNQDACKGAVVTIAYSTTAPVPPVVVPATGTFSYSNGTLAVADVASWPAAAGAMTVQAGDQLMVRVPAAGWDPISYVIVANAAGGEFNYSDASGFYLLAYPGTMELQRAGVHYPRVPAWSLIKNW